MCANQRNDLAVKKDRGWPWSPVALAVILGTWLGGSWGPAWSWLLPATLWVPAGFWLGWRRRGSMAAGIGLASLMLATAGLASARLRHDPETSIHRFLDTSAQLARVRGIVTDPPVQVSGPSGAFARFMAWRPPRTQWVLELRQIKRQQQWEPCQGRLLVRLDKIDFPLLTGQQVEVCGWLSAFEGPLNPGEMDRRAILARRGLNGLLDAQSQGNIIAGGLAGPSWWMARQVQDLRRRLMMAANQSLRRGLQEDPTRIALLEALLLGNRSSDLSLVTEAFRQTGLIHLLSISGAHLGILLLLVGLVAWRVAESPMTVTWIVLGVLGLYLLMLPMQIPIVRTAIMAVCLCLGWSSGRKVTGLAMVSLACVLVLWWKPGELWQPGFQLSYGLTAGLIAFTGPLADWITPTSWQAPGPETRLQRLGRACIGLLAANLVGCALAVPLVAYHFGLISWIALPWSILALPLVTAVIGLGFLKLLLGLIWPTLGYGLAPVVEAPAQALLDLVVQGARLPGACWELAKPIPWIWAASTTAWLISLGLGWWRGHPRLALLAGIGVLFWLGVVQEGDRLWMRWPTPALQTAFKLHMLAVGDGNCLLLRMADPTEPDGQHTLMFDCGSRAALDVGLRTVVPALRALGVHEVDTLMISHVDLDHLSGSIDLAQRLPIRRLLVSPQFKQAAQDRPETPAGYLWKDFQARNIPIQIASQGWQERIGRVELELLWPPADRTFARTNDSSLVLSIRYGPHRVLLTGDIAQEAIGGLVSAGLDLEADVTDLPHHGSFQRANLQWLEMVKPRLLLQSCGINRWRDDPWAPLLAQRDIQRRITQRDGMISLIASTDRQGRFVWSCTTFRDNPTISLRLDDRPAQEVRASPSEETATQPVPP